MVAFWNRADHYIFALWFLLSFFFPRLISAVADWMSAMHAWRGLVRIEDVGLKRAARGSLTIQDAKSHQKSPSGHHRTNLSGYIFVSKARIDNRKNLLSSNFSSTCPHNMVNFGPLAPEIGPIVWGTNFNGFRVLASLLQRRRSTEASQTLHDVWPLPGLVDCIYNFGHCCPVTEFCTALEQWARAKLCGVEHRAPHIFGRATITLGIGPHSSF